MPRRPIVPLALLTFLIGATPARSEETPVPKSHPPIAAFFNGFNKDTLHLLDGFYAPEVEFHDPVSDIRGIDGIRAYYSKMYENLISIRFDFDREVEQGDEVFAPWVMHMRHKSIAGGKEIVVPGVSHFRFKDGKAVYHRDYFDMGVFLYEHVPVIGAGVRYVKKKVAGH